MTTRQAAQCFVSIIPRTRPFQTQFRNMATSGRKFEFLAVIPDKPGVQEKRLQVRPQHFSDMQPRIDADGWKMGGGLLNAVPEDDDASKFDFFGSALVVVAESKEEVLEKLKKDIYTTAGVWDLEKAQIYPFKCGFRREA